MPKKEERKGGLTWNLEQQIIKKYVKKIPKFLSPHRLTYIGVLAAFLVGVSYYLTNFSKFWLIAASFFIFLNWFGDFFDGAVARHRQIVQKRYGYFADHMFDMVSVFFIVFGLGLSIGLHMYFALAFIVGYYLLSINTFLATHTSGKFNMSYGHLGPTEARLILIALNIILLFFSYPLNLFSIGNISITLFDLSTGILLVFIIYTFIEGFVKNLIYLKKVDSKNYSEMSLKEALSGISIKVENLDIKKAKTKTKNQIKKFLDFFELK